MQSSAAPPAARLTAAALAGPPRRWSSSSAPPHQQQQQYRRPLRLQPSTRCHPPHQPRAALCAPGRRQLARRRTPQQPQERSAWRGRARRLRVAASKGGSLTGKELLKVPGIGPRNKELLHQKGLSTVQHLQERFHDEDINSEREKMVEFLRKDVGIVHCRYAGLIVDHLLAMEPPSEGAEEGGGRGARRNLTFCVEGNISVGKTTFLKRISDCIELQDIIQIVPEPIDKWQKVGNSDFNILDAFYSDPSRYAYTFQNYVFVTRLMQEKDSRGSDGRSGVQPLRLLERSVFSDRMVFVRAVHEARWMSDVEINIYDSWFDPIVSALPGLVPDGFIYLRADPETCYKRLLQRARDEEIARVTLPYLEGIHEKHEAWLHPAKQSGPPPHHQQQLHYAGGGGGGGGSAQYPLFPVNGPGQTITVQPHYSGAPAGVTPTEDIRDQVFHLGAGGHEVPGAIRSIPALVLDCNDDINVHLDTEAYSAFGQKIKNFHKYVQETKQHEAEGHKQILTPGAMPAPFGLDGSFSYEQLQKLQQDFGEQLRM